MKTLKLRLGNTILFFSWIDWNHLSVTGFGRSKELVCITLLRLRFVLWRVPDE